MSEEELLSDYADGRLAPAEKAAFEKRLAAEPALLRRARVLKAMKSALEASAPKMPADLKASLKLQARAADSRRRRSPWLLSVKQAFSAPWAFGAGAAAFAAAAVVIALRSPTAAPANPQTRLPVSASSFSDPAAATGLRNLWHDDNGGDGDEE